MTPTEQQNLKKYRRRSRTIGPESRPTFEGLEVEMPGYVRSWSALDVRDPPPEQSRGRQAKSDTGSIKGANARLRGLSLPRQSFRQNSPSDCSSQPSPQTPYGFGEVPPVPTADRFVRNVRDSVLTQHSSTSSSVYPASTSAGTRTETESSMPYTDRDDEADMSYPEIVTPDHPDFDPDDVSNRLRLLLNNSYFLPPAHAKPTPLALSPNDTAKKSKPANAGFLDFFRQPACSRSHGPHSSDHIRHSNCFRIAPPATTGRATASRDTCASTTTCEQSCGFARADGDLATAAKEAEKELRKADQRKAKSQTTPRDRFLDDVIDPTDAVDLPPPSADSIFAVQASSAYGLGPHDSVNAAVLADRLVPSSPGPWSISSEEESWRKALLREAVSHSLGNTPDHSFSSSNEGPRSPTSPTPQSEASFAPPKMLDNYKTRIGQRILEDLSMRTESSEPSPPPSPSEAQHMPRKSSMLSGELSPKAAEHPMLSAADPPARAETPAYMPLGLAPAPRKQLVNPLYSLSQPDLPEAAAKFQDPSPGSSSASYHTVRKTTSTPGLSGAEDPRRAIGSLSPPPLPHYTGNKRGISPDSKDLEVMPSFSTGKSHTGTESRYSSDSMSFRTPMDTDVDGNGARPSMSLSAPSTRPSISVSEYSMPSPTASAFRDAVFGSCRPPSSLSRRSYVSQPEALQEPPPPVPQVTPRKNVVSPPPRISSSVSPTELPIPPRARAARPTHRPSTSSYHSRSSGSSRPLRGSPMSAVHDGSVVLSISSASSPTAPIASRRGLGNPLSLSIPTGFESPVIHSAPAPASPADFFDHLQSTIPNAMDDLETSDESESEDELYEEGQNARSRFNPKAPGESPSTLHSQSMSYHSEPEPESEHVETAHVFVEPNTLAISNRASSSSARPSIMRLGNHSTPQLSPVSRLSPQEAMPQYTYDRKKPIANVVDYGRRSFTSSRSPISGRSPFSKNKGKAIANVANYPLLPIGAMPSSPIAPGTLHGRSSFSSASSAVAVSSTRSGEGVKVGKRPATAPSPQGKGKEQAHGGRKVQRESILRFDGMLVQHLAAERDRMKRITNDYVSSSATNSPVQAGPSGQLPYGR
ncbi:hypothetical protein C8Q74DRAFT_1437016 [Fomes fomentarius]|nr:hypothetical protein C8Q74DRAFT_1437016 [Fomes fomentarius]